MPTLGIAVAAAALAGAASPATPHGSPAALTPAVIRLPAPPLFAVAERALAAGNAVVAERALRAMFADPDIKVRSEARFRLARLKMAQGRSREAAVLLRQVVDDQPGFSRPRLELARLLAAMGDEPAARRELRAASASRLPPELARMVDRWSQSLWARKPVGVSFEVAVAPDSNINRATRLDRLGTVIGDFEIGSDGRARSGIGVAANASAFARLGISDRVDVVARATGSADLYRQHQFNHLSAGVAVGPEMQIGRARVALEAGAEADRYGGRPLSRAASLSASARMGVGPRTWVQAETAVQAVRNRFNPLQGGRGASGSVSIERSLTANEGISISAAVERFAARDPAYSTRAWQVGVQGWTDRGRTTLFAGASAGGLAADERLALLPEARRDRSLQLSVGATMRGLSTAGFAPFVRVIRDRNRSNIAYYDFTRTRTEVGVRRAF